MPNTFTRARPNESKFYYHFIRGGFSTSSVSKIFIPLAGTISGTTLTDLSERYCFLCPFDGSLEKVWARSEGTPGSTVIGFHLDTGSNEIPSETAVRGVTADMSVDDTSYEFDFAAAGTNTFSKGDIIAFSVDPTARLYDVHFMIVLKFDVTT